MTISKTKSMLFLIILLALSTAGAEPDKLLKLRTNFEAAVTRSTAPLQKTYLQELEKLKIEYTRAAKLEDALAVAEEIKKLSPAASNQDKQAATSTGKGSKKELEAYLLCHTWSYSKAADSKVGAYDIIFLPNGKLTQPDPAATNTKEWFWTFDSKGPFLNNVGPIKFHVGDTVLEHHLREGSRWLIRREEPLVKPAGN